MGEKISIFEENDPEKLYPILILIRIWTAAEKLGLENPSRSLNKNLLSPDY